MIYYPNIEGIKYFLYLSTIGQDISYLPVEIREIIWNYCEKNAYMICCINNSINLKLYMK
jgi:hypothetical protein